MVSWYVDCDGNVHDLGEHSPEDVLVEDHGTWKEVHLLAPPDGEPGRAVVDSYELHERPLAEVFQERHIPFPEQR